MSALTDTIDLIVTKTSSDFTVGTKKYKVEYNELDEMKDSFGVLLDSTVKPTEVITDLVGDTVKCKFQLDVYYRVIKPHGGSSDLSYQSILDSMLDFMKATFKGMTVSTNVFIEDLSVLSYSVLNSVYSSGTKDFKGNISCAYERRL